jgi:spore coat polysaccharide biosynthesis predicted glycosyltransferase SpsG
VFLRLDRQLRDGCSRLLVIRAFQKSERPLTKEEQRAFLVQSGYSNPKAQLLSSLSMKEFLQMVEGRVDCANELRIVDQLVFGFDQEALLEFDKRVDTLVQEKL